jgi:hypothetical protein
MNATTSSTYFHCFSGTLVREDMGYTLEKAGKEVLGSASKVVVGKDSTLIVTDGSTQHVIEKRVAQIKGQIEVLQSKNLMNNIVVRPS